MDRREDESVEVISAAMFVAGLVLVVVAMIVPADFIDREFIQPAWPLFRALRLAPPTPDPSSTAMHLRAAWMRLPALFVGALFVLDNLYLFGSARRRVRRNDRPS